jgi:hypothetical protein
MSDTGGQARASAGYALASALGFLVVLSLLGTVVYRSVKTDIVHTGKDSRRVRAEYAAESAVQWGLLELSRIRPGRFPFTLATHGPDGAMTLKEYARRSGKSAATDSAGPWPLSASDLTPFPGATIALGADGWMTLRSRAQSQGVSAGKDELLSFKAWYPNDSTMRITGRAVVDGSEAELELLSTIRLAPRAL